MKNAKITEMLTDITTVRTSKYEAEIERQKAAIETALVKFLEAQKASYEKLDRATVNHQGQNSIWFSFELDADILPEVADFIADEYDLSVNKDYPYKVYGQYQV